MLLFGTGIASYLIFKKRPPDPLGTPDEIIQDLPIPGLPRGLANNNPGNIKFRHDINWLGKYPADQNTDPGRTFEQFNTLSHGYRAFIKNLQSYRKSGRDTLSKIINTWANNSNNAYLDYVVSQTGIGYHEPLSLDTFYNSASLWPIVRAMTIFENGAEYAGYIDDTRPNFNHGFKLA